MNPDRTIAPPCKPILNLNLPIAQKLLLNHNIPFYVVSGGFEPIVRLDVVFDAGLSNQLKKTEAIFTSLMLSEGTKNRSGKQLIDALDFYGSYFQVKCNADDSVATLYCLNKHIETCLPIFFEALYLSVFPEKELSVVLSNSVQKLRVNENKTSFLAKKHFYEKAFGINHPYTVNYSEQDILATNREMLFSFFEQHYQNGIKYLIVSGLIEDKHIRQIENEFNNWTFKSTPSTITAQLNTETGKFFYSKQDALQSSVKIGIPTINRKSEDYTRLLFFNMLFGGYFGSRLMKIIREEKGLTYGIYSVIESYFDTGCWQISTDINNELRDMGINEIYNELNKVKKEGFTDNEINTGKQYYLGSILRGIDGIFGIADRNKLLIDYHLDNNYYNNLVDTIKQISNKELIDVANTYILDDLIEVVVGS